MSKRVIGMALAVFLLLSVLAGCGSSKSANSTKAVSNSGDAAAASVAVQFSEPKAEAQKGSIAGAGDSGREETAEATDQSAAPSEGGSVAVGGNLNTDINNAILAERKIIRSANVTVEVENFDEAYGKISNFILGIGFIQETNINTDRTYVDNRQKLVKRGTIVIRVDKEQFDRVLNNIKGIGDVYNWSINGQDVTDKYIDIESRLRLLKLEETKLEEYLKKVSDLDQIFKIESQLTDIRQEIESFTGNLKKMSDLIELSTITINMNEKYPGQVDPVKPKTYGQRLLSNLTDSLKGVVNFCGELVIILVAALPVLILLGLFIVLILFIYKRIPKKKKAEMQKEPPGENKDNEA
jgi:predicted component of type VI protein secretion system